MKKSILISVVLSFVFLPVASCANVDLNKLIPSSEPTKSIQATPQIAQVQFTYTVTPTATVNHVETAQALGTQLSSVQEAERQKQLELDALNRLMVEATITHEANLLQQAQLAQQSEQIRIQGTQASINATQTIAPTAIPLTATAQAEKNELEKSKMTQTAGEADRIKQKAESEAYAKNAEWIVFVGEFLKFALAFMVASLACLLIANAFIRVKVAGKPVQTTSFLQHVQDLNEKGLKPIPVFEKIEKPDTHLKMRKVYTDIPCSPSELLVLADGICRGMTLAVNQWEGAKVHKRIVDNSMRAWAVSNLFAVPIPGKGGELMVTDKGKNFFEDTVNLKQPPAPFVCMYEDEA